MNRKHFFPIIENIHTAYEFVFKPLCHDFHMTQTAVNILLFLANNPDCCTAKDIVKYRSIKANLVSFNVAKLVAEGYLERHAIDGDRRSIRLVCTDKASPVIERGRLAQQQFHELITTGLSDEETEQFRRYLLRISKNAETIVSMI